MKLRYCLAALAVLLFPVVSFAQSAPATCDPSLANGYVCNTATDTGTDWSLAIGIPGEPANAVGNSVAVGAAAAATGNGSTAYGASSSATGSWSSALGFGSVAQFDFGTAVGGDATANGISASAAGGGAYANGNGTTAIGAFASAGDGTYVGRNPDGTTNSEGSTAIGYGAVAASPGSVAVNGQATNGGTLAIVGQASAQGAAAIYGSATGAGALAIGSHVSGAGSIGIGTGSFNTVTGTESVVIGGNGSDAASNFAVVVGTGAAAVGYGSVAIGSSATATGNNSVAIGIGSTADDNFVVSVGTPSGTAYPNGLFRRIVNLAAGYSANDAVNFSQLGGVTSFLGGGAGFDSAGNPIAPEYVLTNPYTPGTYSTVSDAISALDRAIGDVPAGGGSSTPGPQGPVGPQGPKGDTGAQGPQGTAGKDGTGNGDDALAVHYDNAKLDSVTLGRQPNANGNQTANAVGGPVIVHNLAPGVAGTDAANVDQVQEALTSAETYTDIKATQVLNQANAYTDFRVGQLDGRIKRAIAIGTAQAQMVATYAGADPSSANRVAVGTGWEGGYGAMAVGYQHVSVESKHRITWNVGASISGGDGSVGGGVGFSW